MFSLSGTPKFKYPSTITNIMNHFEPCSNEQAGRRQGWAAKSVLVGANFDGKRKTETGTARTG